MRSDFSLNKEKTGEPSLGTSNNGETPALWQLCKVYTGSYDPELSASGEL